MTLIRLSTERLILRSYTEEDAHRVHAYGSDPEVTRYTSWGPNTWDDTCEFIRGVLSEYRNLHSLPVTLAIVKKETDTVLGGVSLFREDPLMEVHAAEVGYVLHRDEWGRGYATEAAREMIRFGFRELGLRRVYARHQVENLASGRVMQKLGMLHVGVVTEEARDAVHTIHKYLLDR
jgi:RimJ/RimL family protein N-acetyltransferase